MKNNMKTILITGINGFLGSNLAKTLCEKYEIIGLANNTNNLFRLEGFSFKVYSSNDNPVLIFQENKIFAIIHAATVYRIETEPLETLLKTNILLPVKLFELANQFNVKLFLNTDSFFNNLNYTYSYLPQYTLSKKHVLEWLRIIEGECKLINMKLFHMYGPGDTPEKFIPNVFSKLKNNEPYIDTTPAEQTRDFIFIDDVVAAYDVVLEKYDTLTEMFIDIEVGTGMETSIKDFMTELKHLTTSVTKLNFGALNYRKNEIMKSKANNKKLYDLGWVPRFTVAEGLKKMVEYHS